MLSVVTKIILSLFLTAVYGVSSLAECPNGCNCKLTSSGSHLSVDCSRNFSFIDAKYLSQQLDLMLSIDRITERLTTLDVVDTPLTRVASSICQLLNLETLNLIRNRINELPDNCFNKLTKLETLALRWNLIVRLQDGLFDGLQRLVNLDLSYNNISFIGLRLFSNASDLTSLRSLQLDHNQLTSLEPWWYYRCIQGSEIHPVSIVLSNNFISKFTNRLELNYRCGMKEPFGRLDLGSNKITHITDMLNAWNLNAFDKWFCLINPKSSHWRMKFYFGGFPPAYACDCVDFWLYRLVETFPNVNILHGVRCNGDKFSTPSGQPMLAISVPLDKFVCELTDRCPSSCQCVYRPANSTLHVHCSASNLSSLPLQLPPLPKSYVKYKLDFSNNKHLRRLEHRPYFGNTSFLDVSNCSLTEISLQNLKDISHLAIANFHGNMIQSIPQHADTVNISCGLFLGDNPWSCSCDNSWMIGWLKSLSDQILDPGDIVCRLPSRMYGRNVLTSTQTEFCVDPVSRALVIALSTVGSAAILLSIAGLSFYKLRVNFYTKWKFHPFDRDECAGEHMDYDVFLCSSALDEEPHGQRILELIESKGYLVCYHERDFRPGSPILDNITHATERSKRTLCLLSNNFLKSNFCMLEFRNAYHHNLVEKRTKRLIVLKLDELSDLDTNNSDNAEEGQRDEAAPAAAVSHASDGNLADASDVALLRHYLRQYTYIDYTADDWLDKLLYALPLHGLGPANENPDPDIPLLRA